MNILTLKQLVQTLSKKIKDSSFVEEEKELSYIFYLDENVSINIKKIGPDLCFFSKIIACPQKNKEQLFTYLMKANLLGEGTGKSAIGLDNNEKFLTLSYIKSYEDNYEKFKETVEDFVNYLLFWEKEIKKLQKKESIF